jgi:hypothetical protein
VDIWQILGISESRNSWPGVGQWKPRPFKQKADYPRPIFGISTPLWGTFGKSQEIFSISFSSIRLQWPAETPEGFAD